MRNSLSTDGTIQLPSQYSAAHQPRHFARTSGKTKRDWFRIENATVCNDDDDPESPAIIYIYDEIGFWGTDAQTFIQQISTIDKHQIELHINSPGGSVFDGVAIYNALKTHKAEVTVYVDSLAASAASFIAQSGDTLYMGRNATMVIHDASGICMGNEKDMLDTANVLNKLSNNIADIYAQRAGESVDFWRNLMKEEVWYNAQEAVDAGLADDISDNGSEPEDRWDLSMFNYSGRDQAPSPAQVRKLVFNKVKEASVSKPLKNQEPGATGTPSEQTGDTPPEETPAGQPAAPADPATTPAAPPAEPATPAVSPVAPAVLEGAPENRVTGVLINGVVETDPAKIQAYVTGLENAQREQRKMNRKAFIKNLCDSNKITAAQVNSLEEFVNGTATEPGLTDKQYETWCASWSAAASVGGLGRVITGGVTNPTGDPDNRAEQEIEDALEIVRQHKRSNMPKDSLEKTPSYKKLVAANALDLL